MHFCWVTLFSHVEITHCYFNMTKFIINSPYYALLLAFNLFSFTIILTFLMIAIIYFYYAFLGTSVLPILKLTNSFFRWRRQRRHISKSSITVRQRMLHQHPGVLYVFLAFGSSVTPVSVLPRPHHSSRPTQQHSRPQFHWRDRRNLHCASVVGGRGARTDCRLRWDIHCVPQWHHGGFSAFGDCNAAGQRQPEREHENYRSNEHSDGNVHWLPAHHHLFRSHEQLCGLRLAGRHNLPPLQLQLFAEFSRAVVHEPRDSPGQNLRPQWPQRRQRRNRHGRLATGVRNRGKVSRGDSFILVTNLSDIPHGLAQWVVVLWYCFYSGKWLPLSCFFVYLTVVLFFGLMVWQISPSPKT